MGWKSDPFRQRREGFHFNVFVSVHSVFSVVKSGLFCVRF